MDSEKLDSLEGRPPQEALSIEDSDIGVKVIAKKVQEVWEDEFPLEHPDYGDGGYYSDYYQGEPLSYRPFVAENELSKLRKFGPEFKSLPEKRRRLIVEQRLARLKENLNQQKLGIASTIRELLSTVEANPETSAVDLFAKVEKNAPQLRLAPNQLDIFKTACEKYEGRHKMVEKYRALYPNDNELFQACFGVKPVGEVRVIKGPMTLHFQCLSSDDYAIAYNRFKIKEDTSVLTDEDKKQANLSAGAALASVKIGELDGAVTIENSHWQFKYEVVREEKTVELNKSEVELGIDALRSDVNIEVKGQGKWQLRFVARDNLTFPKRIQLIDLNNPDVAPIFDVIREGPDWEGKRYFGVLKTIDDDKTLRLGVTGSLRVKKAEGTQYLGHVDINYADIKIVDNSPDSTMVNYQEDVALPLRVDEEKSKSVQIHEEQHQFNKLFVPWEGRLSHAQIRLLAAEKAESPDEVRQIVAHDLVRARRQELIDGRARDEIIAHYRHGENTENIYNVITKNPLYDYFKDSEQQIRKIPAGIVEEAKEEMSEVKYQKEPDTLGEYGYVLGAVPFELDEALVSSHIKPVFKDEYKRDLEVWLSAVSLLEKKGYNRDEITSILAQEPVSSWSPIARRLGKKE